MSETEHNPAEWPPPFARGADAGVEARGAPAPARLLTGAAWADALSGACLSLVSFTLLTFVLCNPLAASWLSPLDTFFLTGPRFLVGWTLGGVFQVIAWRFFRGRSFRALCFGLAWTAPSVGSLWLFLIILAWSLFG